MRSILLLAPLSLATACVMQPPTTAGPVALGQTARVGTLHVTPLALVEDSRCPMNARCVWAGRVVVKVAIARGNAQIERRLTLGEPAVTDLGAVVLDSVIPERETDVEVEPAAYRFHFSVPAA